MKYKLLVGVAFALSLAVVGQARAADASDLEAKVKDLERQNQILQLKYEDLEADVKRLKKPVEERVEQVLREKGTGTLEFVTADGKPLESVVKRVILQSKARTRWEYHDNLADGDNNVDDEFDFNSNRLDLGFGFEFSDHVTAMAQLRALFTGGGISGVNDPGSATAATDRDTVDVYQAYLKFSDVGVLFGQGPRADVTLGRQELVYGNEMLLGDSDFGSGQSFDALKLEVDIKPVKLDVFFAKIVENNVADDTTLPIVTGDDDTDLFGFYATLPLEGNAPSFDFYVIHLRSRTPLAGVPFVSQIGDADITTIGGRVYGETNAGFDYGLEAAIQFGEIGAIDLDAPFAAEAYVGYKFIEATSQPHVRLGVTVASGDDDPNDSDDGTFRAPFAERHPRLGAADLVSLSNILDIYLQVTLTPTEKSELGAAFHNMTVMEESDTAGAGGAFSNGNPNADDDLLGELDLWWKYRFTPQTQLEIVASVVKIGDFLDDQDPLAATGFTDGDVGFRLYANLTFSW